MTFQGPSSACLRMDIGQGGGGVFVGSLQEMIVDSLVIVHTNFACNTRIMGP